VREWRWFKGDGIRLMDTPMGAIIMREPEPAVWDHPWRVSGGEGSCTVAPGLVNGAMPWIDGRAMDGLTADAQPDPQGVTQLVLKEEEFDDAGLSWVVLRVLCDKDLEILAPDKKGAEIVQTKDRTWGGGYSMAVKSGEGWQGDFPLAMLRRAGDSGFGNAFQIAHFNIRCRVRPGKFWFFV